MTCLCTYMELDHADGIIVPAVFGAVRRAQGSIVPHGGSAYATKHLCLGSCGGKQEIHPSLRPFVYASQKQPACTRTNRCPSSPNKLYSSMHNMEHAHDFKLSTSPALALHRATSGLPLLAPSSSSSGIARLTPRPPRLEGREVQAV
jgi:hypothetical protein